MLAGFAPLVGLSALAAAVVTSFETLSVSRPAAVNSLPRIWHPVVSFLLSAAEDIATVGPLAASGSPGGAEPAGSFRDPAAQFALSGRQPHRDKPPATASSTRAPALLILLIQNSAVVRFLIEGLEV